MKTAVRTLRTPTQKSYDKLMERLEGEGYKWYDGEKLTDSARIWRQFKEDTCISLDEEKDTIGYFNSKWYRENGYKIITIEEYLKEKHLEEWKAGNTLVDKHGLEYWVLSVNGNKYIVSGEKESELNMLRCKCLTRKELEDSGLKLKKEDEKEVKQDFILDDVINLQREFPYISPTDLENIMESFEDSGFLSKNGKKYRKKFWECFIQEK